MRTVQIISFCLLAFLVNANIWDNLFLGQGVSFRLPDDFIIELALEQDFGKVTFKLTGSSSLNCLSITQGVKIKDAPFLIDTFTETLAAYKMNFTAGTLHMNSLLKSCIAVQDDKFETDIYKSIQEFIDIGTLLISREEEDDFYKLDAKKLVEMINIKRLKEINLKDLPFDKIPTKGLPIDKIDLNKLNTSSIDNYADKIPQLVFYFNKKNHNLKRIQVTLPNQEKYSLEVVSIQSYKATPADFSLPSIWSCEKEQAKPLHELDLEEIIKEIQKDPSSTLAMITPWLPKEWAILDLNKLINQYKDLLSWKNNEKKSDKSDDSDDGN